jgi:uncharacterized DUF497 family protein
VRYRFRWNDWNVAHIDTHNIAPEEAEYVVNRARAPFPRDMGDEKFLVRGQAESGEWIQVIYVFDPPGVVYVIHARPMTDAEKRTTRRGRR